MTAMWDDEKVSRLVSTGGIEGLAAFGMYCRVLDIVASQMDSKTTQCSVTYGITRWSLLLSLRGSHVRHWFEKLALTHLLTVEWIGTEIQVTIPKLVKYRDEYSKKSGDHPSQRTEQNRTEVEQNTTEEEPREVPVREVVDLIRPVASKATEAEIWFEDVFWEAWPIKENRIAAKKSAVKIGPEERQTVIDGVISWTSRIRAMERPIHASTWLNNRRWEDALPLFTLGGNGKRSAADGVMDLVKKRIEMGMDPL